jgi:hypothetical protein
VQIKQSAQSSDESWWNWSVWLEGTAAELNIVQFVVYTLHPTFADPVRVVTTRKNGFRLDSAGWGEFEIYIEIRRLDGKTVKRTHYLKLVEKESASKRSAPRKRRVARKSSITKPPRASIAKSPRTGLRKMASRPAAAAEAVPPSGPTLEHAPDRRAPKLFLSSSAADAQFTRKLREFLETMGFQTISGDAAKPGVPVDYAIKQAIDASDAMVFVVSSGAPSLWSKLEMTYATNREHVKPVIPVLVGSKAEMPEPLASFNAVRASPSQDAGSVASEIAKVVGALAG